MKRIYLDTLQSKNDLAELYKEQTQYEEAESLLLEAVKGRRFILGDTHPHTLESWQNLIELYEAWNKPEKAKELRAKLPQTEAVKEWHVTQKRLQLLTHKNARFP